MPFSGQSAPEIRAGPRPTCEEAAQTPPGSQARCTILHSRAASQSTPAHSDPKPGGDTPPAVPKRTGHTGPRVPGGNPQRVPPHVTVSEPHVTVSEPHAGRPSCCPRGPMGTDGPAAPSAGGARFPPGLQLCLSSARGGAHRVTALGSLWAASLRVLLCCPQFLMTNVCPPARRISASRTGAPHWTRPCVASGPERLSRARPSRP